jgi:hypothetical protein
MEFARHRAVRLILKAIRRGDAAGEAHIIGNLAFPRAAIYGTEQRENRSIAWEKHTWRWSRQTPLMGHLSQADRRDDGGAGRNEQVGRRGN